MHEFGKKQSYGIETTKLPAKMNELKVGLDIHDKWEPTWNAVCSIEFLDSDGK